MTKKIGTEFVVNTHTYGEQNAPQISSFPSGYYIITWVGSDGSSSGIKAQLFFHNNTKIGTEFVVNTHTYGEQNAPQISSFPSGDYIITWVGSDGSSSGIKAYLFSAVMVNAHDDPIIPLTGISTTRAPELTNVTHMPKTVLLHTQTPAKQTTISTTPIHLPDNEAHNSWILPLIVSSLFVITVAVPVILKCRYITNYLRRHGDGDESNASNEEVTTIKTGDIQQMEQECN